MASTLEGLVFDGLDLNDRTNLILQGFEFLPARKRQEWAQGADTDGALLIRDPLFDNAELVVRLRVAKQTTMNLALAKLTALSAKLEEAEQQPDGLALVWTPATATTSMTMYVLSGQVDGLPISLSGDDAGWFLLAPVITLRLTCKPFGYGTPLANITDDFSTNTIANYTFDSGSGTLSITGGQLVPSTTGGKEVYYSAAPYSFSDQQVTLKVVTGAAVAGSFGVILRRLDANNYLLLQHSAAQLQIVKKDGGAFTTLATAAFVLSTATSYWIRGRAEGNTLTVEAFTSAPTAVSVPAATATYALSTVPADATKFGVGISGQAGFRFASNGTDYRYDDFSIEPNLARSSSPIVTSYLAGVPGDVPAEGRLIVTDGSSQNRRYVEWGLEWRYMDGTLVLLLDSDSLVTSGFSGTGTTRTGAYDPNAAGNNVVRGTLYGSPTAVCGTGNQSHVGTYRVKARVYASAAGQYVRFAWQEGDGPYRANAYAVPSVSAGFSEVDLGLINIPPKQLGTQRWSGRVEGYTVGAPGTDTLDVDHLVFVPAGEGYGRARGQLVVEDSTVAVARDEFNQAAGALNAKTADVGGAWATSGDATDFSVSGSGTVSRTATADAARGRFAISGAAASALQASSVDISSTVLPLSASDIPQMGLVSRWVDASNYCGAVVTYNSGIAHYAVYVLCRVAAVDVYTAYSAALPTLAVNTYYRLTMAVDASGNIYVWLCPRGSSSGDPVFVGQHSSVATGGALASGKPGFQDFHFGGLAATRTYDNFLSWVPNLPTSLYSTRQMEFRSDGAIRQDSTGTYYGPTPAYRGSRFMVPPAGDENRTSRVLVKADRNDIEAASDEPVGDTLQAQVLWTPRYLLPKSS
jgi:hypothetical protein